MARLPQLTEPGCQPRADRLNVAYNSPGCSGGLAVSGNSKHDSGTGISSTLVRVLVGCPSGQREQTVNLPADAYEGSNPSPTISRVQANARLARSRVRERSRRFIGS